MFIVKLLKWVYNLKSNRAWWGNCPFLLLGGGDEATPPPQPSAQETSQEAIQAQIAATPQILETQQEFGPQFTQLELDQLKEFGPQFARELLDLQKEFGVETATALRDEQRALSPELAAAQDALQSFLGQEDLLTPEEERIATQDIRQAQNVRGFGIASGVGAEAELEGLTKLRQELKTRRLNIALSTAGRVPIGGQSGVQQQQFGPGQLVQNVDPNSIFGLASSNFATGAGIFGAQQQAKTTYQQGLLSGVKGILAPNASFGPVSAGPSS